MAELILIQPDNVIATTILGGNLDPAKYVINILFAQLNTLEPLLGYTLYEKILKDYEDNALTGKYLTLYDEFVEPILKYESVAQYVEVGNFMVENGGTFLHVADNRQVTTKDDTQFLAGKYHSMAQMYIQRFQRWICVNPIPEYTTYVNGQVNAQNVKATAGWYFGRAYEGFNPDLIETNGDN